jgi:hypothetical protein
MGLPHGTWNARESAYDLPNGSRVYCVHLKTSQRDNRFATVRGLTVAIFYINQLEEVPEDVADEAALRISQPGFPQMLVADPNAVPEHHWIAKRWPVTNDRADHLYLRVAMRDNAHNLDAKTIDAAEALYPEGHPLRRIKIEGRRGLDVQGTPVYLGAFSRTRHVKANRSPFTRSCRCSSGTTTASIIRASCGASGRRGAISACSAASWAPTCISTRSCRSWSATGSCGSRRGCASRRRAIPPARTRTRRVCAARPSRSCDWYAEHGERDADNRFVSPVFQKDANHPERRYAANQKAATYMRRKVNGEEGFLVDDERWVIAELTDERLRTAFSSTALEAGYVLEPRAAAVGPARLVLRPEEGRLL